MPLSCSKTFDGSPLPSRIKSQWCLVFTPRPDLMPTYLSSLGTPPPSCALHPLRPQTHPVAHFTLVPPGTAMAEPLGSQTSLFLELNGVVGEKD